MNPINFLFINDMVLFLKISSENIALLFLVEGNSELP